MKTTAILSFVLLLAVFARAQQIKFPQFTVILDYGKIGIGGNNPLGVPRDELYHSVLDSAGALLKKNGSDTTALFLVALMKSQKNLLTIRTAKYWPPIDEACAAIEKGFQNGLSSLIAKVLRARIYYQLKMSYIVDEGWQFKDNATRLKRKALFEKYQSHANKYYGELKVLDPGAAWEYQKMIKVEKYPLEVK